MNHDTAIDYFDRMTRGGQFAGFPALALTKTAQLFGLDREELRGAILSRRESERLAIAKHTEAARDLFDALRALTPPADLGEVDLDDEDRQSLDNARAVLAKWEGKL